MRGKEEAEGWERDWSRGRKREKGEWMDANDQGRNMEAI